MATQQSFDTLLECPIAKTRFQNPVIAADGYTYEREAIVHWLQTNPSSPMTRQDMSVDSLRPNDMIKQILELEKRLARGNYKFKLNVDVKKKRNRPLVQSGGKFLYEAEWLNNPQGPEIVLLQIRGARARKEAAFYVQLSRHPNIVRTFGFVESGDESNTGFTLLQEYAPLGDLSELLINESILPNNLKVFYEIFLEIIDAMIYLVQKGIVHGDLTCGNILVFKFHHADPNQILVKLTDFGLTRGSLLYQTTTYATSATIHPPPLRSSAPEILQAPHDRQVYTDMSDMFSMGVLMWEALSKGAFPWDELEDGQVRTKVIKGERLKRPSTTICTDHLWSIILKCMNHRPQGRPTFTELHRLISNLFPDRTPPNLKLRSLCWQLPQPTTASATSEEIPPSASSRVTCVYCSTTCTQTSLLEHQRSCWTNPDNRQFFVPTNVQPTQVIHTINYSNGDRYEGNLKDGKKHGHGTMYYKDRSIYIGDWVNDNKNGLGVRTWLNGGQYQGAFKDGKKHGHGTLVDADGAEYQGDWLDEELHGRGVIKTPEGLRIESDFKNGKMHGCGTYYSPNGDRFKANFQNDMKNGPAKLIQADGRSLYMDYKNDKCVKCKPSIEYNWRTLLS